ncbi:MAG: hypothetical protein JRE81_16355, partial [Deltaproteobacteria bacterium]|nr:hypothetical protein [Deltaproteobacteria bacterium]
MSCAKTKTSVFVDYWCGDLDATAAEAFEEHLFACDDCAAQAERLLAAATLVRERTALGKVASLILTRSAMDRLQRDEVPIRHYRVGRGETVPCQATPDHFSVVHLRLDGPTPRTRVDLGVETARGEIIRCEDVPINHLDGEISLAWPGDMVRA